MNELKSIRLEKKLTQQNVADLLNISVRSYKSYENDENKIGTIKYNYIKEKLLQINLLDENNGILTIDDIKNKLSDILKNYDVNYCFLFGSYAKKKATPTSDVDLLLSANIKGLDFYGLVEEIRASLHKKIDLLDVKQLQNNLELIEEILKDGIKIYG